MCIINTVIAQSKISSPYSGFGLGNLEPMCNAYSRAMGGVAYTQQNSAAVNFANPASYVAFDSLSFVADVAGSLIFGNLKTSATQQQSFTGRLDYLAIGMPVTKHWRTSLGLLPYSLVGYTVYDEHTDSIFGSSTYLYEGNGGLTNVYWGNAFKICKGLSLGLNMTYMFGSLDKIQAIEFTDDEYTNSQLTTYNKVNGLLYDIGIQYFVDIKKKHRLGLALVYKDAAHVWLSQTEEYITYTGTGIDMDIEDTLLITDKIKSSITMPRSLGGGLSYQFQDRIYAGVDFTWQDWSSYLFNGESGQFHDNYITSVGVQYTRNPNSNKYLQKINWRLGFKYETGYLQFQDFKISGFAISFGMGLPIKRNKSTVNLFLEYGQKGKTVSNLIRENYVKLGFQFILHEKWYKRQKLN